MPIRVVLVDVIALLSTCASGPGTTDLNGVEVSAFDEGARWLSQGIDEVSAPNGVSDEQRVVLIEYVSDLMADPMLRSGYERHDVFLSRLESEGYLSQALEAAEAAMVRASS